MTNTTKYSSTLRAVAAVLLTVMATPGVTQQPAQAPAKKPVPQQEPETHVPGTIQVHGHWELTVVNPDGSIAEHRAFHNSLVAQGALAGVVTGVYTQGFVMIEAANHYIYPQSSKCPTSVTTYCHANQTATLTGTSALLLNGTIDGGDAGYTISEVRTMDYYCSSGTWPSTVPQLLCAQGLASPSSQFSSDLTAVTLPTPLTVLAHQAVQVKVTLSFS